jgi:hypothetical protein
MAKRRGVLIVYDNGYCLKFVNELVLWLLLVYQEIQFRRDIVILKLLILLTFLILLEIEKGRQKY